MFRERAFVMSRQVEIFRAIAIDESQSELPSQCPHLRSEIAFRRNRGNDGNRDKSDEICRLYERGLYAPPLSQSSLSLPSPPLSHFSPKDLEKLSDVSLVLDSKIQSELELENWRSVRVTINARAIFIDIKRKFTPILFFRPALPPLSANIFDSASVARARREESSSTRVPYVARAHSCAYSRAKYLTRYCFPSRATECRRARACFTSYPAARV